MFLSLKRLHTESTAHTHSLLSHFFLPVLLALVSLFGTTLVYSQSNLPEASSNQIFFSPDVIEKVLRHGPWPPSPIIDPSNRVSGIPMAIELGQLLFNSEAIAANDGKSCAACHQPERAFSDGLARAIGHTQLDRNTLSLFNLPFQRWFGWSGKHDNLWSQSLAPLLLDEEMGLPVGGATAIAQMPIFIERYKHLFGDPESQSDQENLVNLGKAMAAYQETLITGITSFDRFREALEVGNEKEIAYYPTSAKRGLALFVGRGNCHFCHSGPLFSNGEFHDAGVPFFIEQTRVDEGRHAGITALLKSPYTLVGRFNDDPKRSTAWRTERLVRRHDDFGIFRVPGLRGVSRTAPYMHNGSLETLEDVVRHYSEIDLERMHADGEAILKPLKLNEAEISDLVAFLESLSDD